MKFLYNYVFILIVELNFIIVEAFYFLVYYIGNNQMSLRTHFSSKISSINMHDIIRNMIYTNGIFSTYIVNPMRANG
jgi:hypothetical protein